MHRPSLPPEPELAPLLHIGRQLVEMDGALLYTFESSGGRALLAGVSNLHDGFGHVHEEVAQWRLQRPRLVAVPQVGRGPSAPESTIAERVGALLNLPVFIDGLQWASLVLVHPTPVPDLAERVDRDSIEAIAQLLSSYYARGRQHQPGTMPPPTRGIDDVTGLLDRRKFVKRLGHRLAQPGGEGVAVVLLALDRFRRINDWLGRHVGDELLRQVGARLEALGGDEDVVARAGGDELAVIVEGARHGPGQADRLLQAIREPFHLHGYELSVSAGVGISRAPEDATDPELLLRYAAIALHLGKERGRGRLQLFTPEMREAVERRGDLERHLRRAIGAGELELFYQPKVDIQSGETCGLEALLRWRQGDELVRPSQFIPVAEDSGLIVPIGSWCLLSACRQHRAWLAEGLRLGRVSVNVSPRQFSRPDFVGTVARALQESGLAADRLELEVIESSIMNDVDEAAQKLAQLRGLGVRVSVDDFGTGYSSLAYLQRLPVDVLKIDRSFIKDLDADGEAGQQAVALARAITGLGQSLDLEVLAEGVETEGQLAAVRALGVKEVQGFYFARPMPVVDVPGWQTAHEGGPRTGHPEQRVP
jgi:diguanylate cyclase (GGDEF)-like protein